MISMLMCFSVNESRIYDKNLYFPMTCSLFLIKEFDFSILKKFTKFVILKKPLYIQYNVICNMGCNLVLFQDGTVFLIYIVLWALGVLVCITNAARYDAAKLDNIAIGPGISVVSLCLLLHVNESMYKWAVSVFSRVHNTCTYIF